MRQPLHVQDEEFHPAEAGAQVLSGSGKLQGRESIVAPGTSISSVVAASQGSLSIYCHRLRRFFLVDSGADVSVYPAGVEDRRLAPSSSLSVANGTKIGITDAECWICVSKDSGQVTTLSSLASRPPFLVQIFSSRRNW